MKRISRKYILIILAFLTTLLCMVGSSTWLILSQKTATPNKRDLITPTLSNVKIETPLFYGDSIENKDIQVTGTATATLPDGSTTPVKGKFTVTNKTITAFSSTSVTATTDGTGYTFTNANNTATVTFTPENQDLYTPNTYTVTGANIPIYAVVTYDGTYYNTLSAVFVAVENASSGTINVLPSSYPLENKRAVSAKTITTENKNNTVSIPSGITLSLSYKGTTNFELLNTASSYDSHDVPAFENRTHSYYASESDAKKEQATSINPYETYLKNKVTLGSNVILNNFGTIVVGGIIGGGNGGKAYSSHTAADFAQLTLASGSKIVNYTAGGKASPGIQSYGLITETSAGASLGIDNKGSMLSPFTLREHRGGSAFFAVSGVDAGKLIGGALTGAVNAAPDIMPFNRFYFPNITPSLTMAYSSEANKGVIYAYADLYAQSQHNETTMGVVGNTAEFLLQLKTNASITIDYNSSTQINTLDIYGDATLNSLGFTLHAYVDLLSKNITVNIATTNAHFPITWYYDINLHKAKNGSNATVTLNQKIKIMPGGSISVDKGVKLTGSEIAVYSNGYESQNTASPSGATYVAPKYGTTYPSTSSKSGTSFKNGELLVNGELSVTTYGGGITSTQSGAKFGYTTGSISVKELSHTTGSGTDATATPYTVTHSLALPTVSGTTNSAGTYYSKKTTSTVYWGTPATVSINYSGTTITDKTYTDYLIGETYTLTSSDLPTPTKDHYTFNEWYFDSAFTDKADVGDIISVSSSNIEITLYPKFTPITYNIEYQYTGLDGVTYPDLPDGLSTTFSIESGNIALPINMTWDGTNYTFSGWYFDANCTNDAPTSIPFETLFNYAQNGTLTLYGEWTETVYNVTLTAGTNAPYSISDISLTTGKLNYIVGEEYQKSFTAHDDKLTAEYQYYFDGWYLDENLTIPYNGTLKHLDDTTFETGDSCTLYAKWSQKKLLTLDYDTATNPNVSPIGDTTVYLRPNGQEYTLSTFTSDTATDVPKYSSGWSIVSGTAQFTGENDSKITITADTTIKVIWADKITVTLKDTNTTAFTTISYYWIPNTTFTIPTDIINKINPFVDKTTENKRYYFNGWSGSNGDSFDSVSIEFTPKSTVTYTVVFVEKSSITYKNRADTTIKTLYYLPGTQDIQLESNTESPYNDATTAFSQGTNTATLTTYSPNGWYITSMGEKRDSYDFTSTTVESVTLYPDFNSSTATYYKVNVTGCGTNLANGDGTLTAENNSVFATNGSNSVFINSSSGHFYAAPNTTFSVTIEFFKSKNKTLKLNNTALSSTSESGNTHTYNVTITTAPSTLAISANADTCLVEGTLITLADGTKKKIEDVTMDDSVLVFNHETGKYEAGKIWFSDHADEPATLRTIINLVFSNGTVTRISYEHGFFDLDLNKYIFIDESNMLEYIGHRFYTANYNGTDFVGGEITLVNAYITEEVVKVYGPITEYHFNMVSDGLLSMPSFNFGVRGFINIFEYGEDLKFDAEKMQADIEKYGLFTYEDFKEYMSYEDYCKAPIKYFKISIAKGYLTYEEIELTLQYLYENGFAG